MNYAQILIQWFNNNKRSMPWREKRDAYSIWVSEVMLQQTQVNTVIPYYNRFIERFPSVEILASADIEEVYQYWQGLGYYRRAVNLHKGAKKVVEEYKGVFPKDPKIAKDIPSIGPYTLGAVLSIAYGIKLPAVDGNVMRVLSRQFLIKDDIGIAKNRKTFEQKVMELMGDDPNSFNQALMELGATICTPKKPLCEQCPMRYMCEGFKTRTLMNYPVKAKKVKVQEEHYKVVVIKQGDRYWMHQRPKDGLLPDMWAFPLVEKEEWEAKYMSDQEVERDHVIVKHVFTHRRWIMKIIVLENDEIDFKIKEQLMNKGKFVSEEEIRDLAIATAFRKVIKHI